MLRLLLHLQLLQQHQVEQDILLHFRAHDGDHATDLPHRLQLVDSDSGSAEIHLHLSSHHRQDRLHSQVSQDDGVHGDDAGSSAHDSKNDGQRLSNITRR